MFSSNNKISLRQLQVLIFINGFSSVFLLLSKFLAKTSRNFGVILILLLGLFISFFVSFCINIFEKYKKENFKDMIIDVFGKYLGNIICFIMSLKLILSSALMLRIFCEFIRETTLSKTHISITAGIIIIICIYSYKNNIENFARVSEIIFITVFFPILLVFSSAIINTDYTNILPLFEIDKVGIFQGLAISSCIFFGIENIFINYSYINKNKYMNNKNISISKSVFVALIFLTICSTISYFFTVTRFGVETTAFKLFPMIVMLDTVEIPGAFIERQLLFVLWAVIGFIFVFVNSGFISMYSILNIRNKVIQYFLGIFVVIICILPKNIIQTIKLFFNVNILGSLLFGIILPFIIVLYCILKRREK